MRLNIFSCELHWLSDDYIVLKSYMIMPYKYLALSLSHNNSQLTVQPLQTLWYHNTISPLGIKNLLPIVRAR